MVPYFIDRCMSDPADCNLMHQYIDFCFEYQDEVLDAKDWSQRTIIRNWTYFVSETIPGVNF